MSIAYLFFKGEVLGGHDAVGYKAMAQQSIEFKEKHGHYPLWTNSMLSGMPAYQIALESKYNVTLAYLDIGIHLVPPFSGRLIFSFLYRILPVVHGNGCKKLDRYYWARSDMLLPPIAQLL